MSREGFSLHLYHLTDTEIASKRDMYSPDIMWKFDLTGPEMRQYSNISLLRSLALIGLYLFSSYVTL